MPPVKITKGIYLCDKRFHTQSIIELYQQPTLFGLVIISGDFAQLSLVKSFEKTIRIKPLYTNNIRLQKSQRKGGQSAQRIGRLREENHFNYISIVLERMNSTFDTHNIKGLFILGSSTKKEDLSSRLNQKYRNLLLATLTSTSRPSQTEIIEKITPFINNIQNASINKQLTSLLDPNNELVVYGRKEVQRELKYHQLRKLIVHGSVLDKKSVDVDKLKIVCDDHNTKLIIININNDLSETFINGYGGYVGVKWY